MKAQAYTDSDFTRLSPYFAAAAAGVATPSHSAENIEATMYLELCYCSDLASPDNNPVMVAESMAQRAVERLQREDTRNTVYTQIAALLQEPSPLDVPIVGIAFDTRAARFFQGENWEQVSEQISERLNVLITTDPVLVGLIARYDLIVIDEPRLSGSTPKALVA